MVVWSLPWGRDEQIKVCIALKNIDFLNYSDKDEVDRIERSLSFYAELSESEKQFLEKLIQDHGSRLEIN